MRREALAGHDVMTVGESPGATVEKALEAAREGGEELNMVFQFELMGIDHTDGDKWRQRHVDLVEMKRIVERWQRGLYLKGWNSNYLMNHDQPRQAHSAMTAGTASPQRRPCWPSPSACAARRTSTRGRRSA